MPINIELIFFKDQLPSNYVIAEALPCHAMSEQQNAQYQKGED